MKTKIVGARQRLLPACGLLAVCAWAAAWAGAQAPVRIARELEEFVKSENLANAGELVGTLKL